MRGSVITARDRDGRHGFLPGRERRRGWPLARAFHLQRGPVPPGCPAASLLPPSDGAHPASTSSTRSTGRCPSRPCAASWRHARRWCAGDRHAAVDGAGSEMLDEHPEDVLHHRDGRPWMLGRTSSGSWTSRGTRHAARRVPDGRGAAGRFDGLHLDQYGDPKVAVTAAGTVVDLAEGFVAIIEAVRAELPDATLIFNNVNDFPTTTTASAPQDVPTSRSGRRTTTTRTWSGWSTPPATVDPSDRWSSPHTWPRSRRAPAGPGRGREAGARDRLVRGRPVPALRRASRCPDPPVLPELRDPR